MKAIDVSIVNRALQSPGRLDRSDRDFVSAMDRKRVENPFVRLNFHERQRLKRIGRIFEIFPESYSEVASPSASEPFEDLQNRERELVSTLTKRGN